MNCKNTKMNKNQARKGTIKAQKCMKKEQKLTKFYREMNDICS